MVGRRQSQQSEYNQALDNSREASQMGSSARQAMDQGISKHSSSLGPLASSLAKTMPRLFHPPRVMK